MILGLLVGGTLAGKSLIRAAQLRAQIEQINQYNAAVRTFQGKYLDLPGDMPLAKASSFKFYRDGSNGVTDSGCSVPISGGCGDGNGQIGLWLTDDQQAWQTGEPHLFWLDLMVSRLIAAPITAIAADRGTDSTDVKAYLPQGKISGQFVYVWTGGVPPADNGIPTDGRNYFTVSGVTRFAGYDAGMMQYTASNMRVIDAYNIDTKVDDGLPQYGNTTAALIRYITGGSVRAAWVGPGTGWGGYGWGGPTTMAVAASATTCYDNNNTAGQKQQYSMSVSENANCALSFVMK